MLIDKDLTINVPGANLLTVRRSAASGTPYFSIFHIVSGNVTISGLTIANGASGNSFGGGIFNQSSGTLTVTGCTISGNAANGDGGGIYNSKVGTATITNSTISANSCGAVDLSRGDGGGIRNSGTLTVTGCTISGNFAPSFGGGISNFGPMTITNSTISGNSALGGGAIYNGGTVTITNSTLSGNSAANGGGIFNGVMLQIGNSILNAGESGANIFNDSGTVTSHGYNLSSDDGGGFLNSSGDQINADPLLGPLQDNGGLTKTHALLSGSTAINAGNDATAPLRDQRGYVRSGVSDIGAFEFGGTIPVTLANISTRVQVGHNDDVLIGGFIITGSQPKRLLFRALGASVPLNGVLSDTVLTLYGAAGQVIATNDNWRTNSNAQEIEATGLAPGDNSESAILTSLAPGAYTALVSGANGVMFSPGIGLVEVYDLDRTVNSKLANISSRGLVQTATM